jgi:hypothetical protein
VILALGNDSYAMYAHLQPARSSETWLSGSRRRRPRLCWSTDAGEKGCDGGAARVRNVTVDLTDATTTTLRGGTEVYTFPITGGAGVLQ